MMGRGVGPGGSLDLFGLLFVLPLAASTDRRTKIKTRVKMR